MDSAGAGRQAGDLLAGGDVQDGDAVPKHSNCKPLSVMGNRQGCDRFQYAAENRLRIGLTLAPQVTPLPAAQVFFRVLILRESGIGVSPSGRKQWSVTI